MSKTKEHIFDEIVGEHHRTLSPANYSNVVKAMDEHAKNQGVAFIHWVTNEQVWVRNASGDWVERNADFNPKIISTQQLYALFLQSQSQ